MPTIDSYNNILRIDAIRYGEIDLSEASDGIRPLRIEDLDLKGLDVKKLQNLQRFAPVGP